MTQDLKLELRGVRKKAVAGGRFDLHCEDLAVRAGDRMALVGPSGCGKSTFFRVLAGLEPWDMSQDAGSIWISGRAVERLPPEKRDIGLIFQQPTLLPALSVGENVAFGLRMRGVAKAERLGVAADWLMRLGLADRIAGSIDGLSGGEQQRVAFARALCFRPKALLLDEPFSAVDPKLRGQMRAELLKLLVDWPTPVILVTHDEEDVRALATARLGIREKEGGAVREVYQVAN